MNRQFRPWVGAAVNFLVYGSADIYVGQTQLGVLKIIFFYPLALLVVMVIENVAVDILSHSTYFRMQQLLGASYVLFTTISGYRTVVKHNQRRVDRAGGSESA